MAESTQQLVFKLIVDGKEATATLDVVKGEFIETGEAAEQTAKKIKEIPEKGIAGLANTPHLKQFAQDLLQIDASAEEASMGIAEFIKLNQLSEAEIEQVVNALRQEQATMGIATAEYKSHQSAISSLIAVTTSMRGQQAGMNAGMQAGIPGVNQMRMAMSQFGYVLNDAQVFMVNARMGLMGISNNIPMIVQNFIQAKNAAGGTATTMQLLTKAVTGGGGLIIGINALMLLMNVLPGLFNDTTEAAADQTDEIKKLTNEYERLTQAQIKRKRSEVDTELSELTKEYQSKYGDRSEFLVSLPLGIGRLFESFKELSEEEQKRYTALVNQKQALDEASAKVGFRKDLENEINQLMEKRDAIKNPEAIKALDEWIKRDKELLKQTELQIDNTERFLENKQKAVDKFIQEEYRQNEAARLAGLTYEELLTELENAERDYAVTADKIKNTQSQNELDALTKLADLTEIRIDIISDYMDDLEKEMDEIDNELKKFGAELDKQIAADEEKRQKFQEERQKFFRELPAQIESDPFERAQKELDAEEQLTIERAQLYGATEEQITAIKNYYENERLRITEEAHQHEMDLLQDKINQIQSAYSQIYSIISSNVRGEINEWKTKEEEKLEQERNAALNSAQTQAQREKINEQFDKRKEALQREADKKAQTRLEMWFNLQKAMAIAEITINLAKAIAVEWGKLGTFAAFTQGLIIAALTAQLAVVAAQKFPKGFAEGGRLPKGKAGIIEGTHNEIIAPEEDFKTIFKTYSAELVKHALVDYKNYVTVNSGAAAREDLSAIKETLTNLDNAIKDGIKAQAFLDDETAYEIYLKGRAMYRKGKI